MAARKQTITTASLEESETETPEENHEIDVTPTDDGDDEEGGLEAEGETEEAKPTRKERRRQRIMAKERQDEYEERLRQAEQRAVEAERRAAYEQGQREALARQQQSEVDPETEQIKKIRKRKEEINELFLSLTPEQQAERRAELQEEANQLNEEEVAAIQRRENRRNGIGRPQDPMAAVHNSWVQKHASDILAAPVNVQQWGLMRVRQLVVEGYPMTEETVALAAEQTRKAFNMTSRLPAAARRQGPPRSTLTGISSNGTGNGSGSERSTVVMNEDFKKMARARYPNLPPEDAYKAWAKYYSKYQQKHGA